MSLPTQTDMITDDVPADEETTMEYEESGSVTADVEIAEQHEGQHEEQEDHGMGEGIQAEERPEEAGYIEPVPTSATVVEEQQEEYAHSGPSYDAQQGQDSTSTPVEPPLTSTQDEHTTQPPAIHLSFNDQSFALFSTDSQSTSYLSYSESTSCIESTPAPPLPIDTQIYTSSLSDLIESLRVSSALGDFLEEDGNTELVLEFPELELTVGEDNVHAQSVTLADLVQLHEGLGLQESLRVEVREEVRFIAQYNLLAEQVAQHLIEQREEEIVEYQDEREHAEQVEGGQVDYGGHDDAQHEHTEAQHEHEEEQAYEGAEDVQEQAHEAGQEVVNDAHVEAHTDTGNEQPSHDGQEGVREQDQAHGEEQAQEVVGGDEQEQDAKVETEQSHNGDDAQEGVVVQGDDVRGQDSAQTGALGDVQAGADDYAAHEEGTEGQEDADGQQATVDANQEGTVDGAQDEGQDGPVDYTSAHAQGTGGEEEEGAIADAQDGAYAGAQHSSALGESSHFDGAEGSNANTFAESSHLATAYNAGAEGSEAYHDAGADEEEEGQFVTAADETTYHDAQDGDGVDVEEADGEEDASHSQIYDEHSSEHDHPDGEEGGEGGEVEQNGEEDGDSHYDEQEEDGEEDSSHPTQEVAFHTVDGGVGEYDEEEQGGEDYAEEYAETYDDDEETLVPYTENGTGTGDDVPYTENGTGTGEEEHSTPRSQKRSYDEEEAHNNTQAQLNTLDSAASTKKVKVT